jgi:uncharacterized repeat protein (TIGR03803 family)
MLRTISASCAVGIAVITALIGLSLPSLAQTESLVYSFQGAPDGSIPSAHLIKDSSGNLYGTTAFGGSKGFGTVFKINNKGLLTILYNFAGGTDGANPVAALIHDSAGNLYGTTQAGGNANSGTIFKITAAGKESALYAFKGTTDGAAPLTALLRDGAGNLYGTTSLAGNSTCRTVLGGSGCGTLFKLNTSGKLMVLHTFGTGTDGASPAGDLISDSSGNMYGTTYAGGIHGYGSVYKVTKGTVSVPYSFNFGVGADGARPLAGVVRDSSGNLYGTTRFGGFFGNSTCQGFGCGTVFKIDSSGTETVLYTFTGNPDGYDPQAALVMDSSTNLYGTTAKGGTNSSSGDQGTVFRLEANGTESILHSFGSGSDGFKPLTGLTPGSGAYYGTASQGGSAVRAWFSK